MRRKTLVTTFGVTTFVVLFMFTVSCDVTEPERFYNDFPEQEHTAILTLAELDPEKHYAGTFTLTGSFDSHSFESKKLVLFVDDDLVGTWWENSFTYDLRTQSWEEGDHTLTFGIVGEEMGLATYLDLPIVLYSIELTFDQTPPSQTELIDVGWEGNYARITWRQSPDLNFGQYIVYRDYQQVDTIRTQSDTVFVDSTFTRIFGTDLATYYVGVSNNAEVAFSNQMNLSHGGLLDVMTEGHYGGEISPIVSATSDEIYILDDNTRQLKTFSTITNELLESSTSLPDDRSFGMAKSLESNEIFVWSPENTYRFDSATQDWIHVLDEGLGQRAILGRDDRAYFRSTYLYGYNLSTGNRFGWEQNFLHTWSSIDYYQTSSDGNILYMVDFVDNQLFAIDIATDTFRILEQTTLDHDLPQWLQLSMDETLLLYTNRDWGDHSVEIVSASTLDPHSRVSLGEAEPSYLLVVDDYLLVAVQHYDGGDFDGAAILKYRISNLELLDTWLFASHVELFAVAANWQHMYVFCRFESQGFIVPLD